MIVPLKCFALPFFGLSLTVMHAKTNPRGSLYSPPKSVTQTPTPQSAVAALVGTVLEIQNLQLQPRPTE